MCVYVCRLWQRRMWSLWGFQIIEIQWKSEPQGGFCKKTKPRESFQLHAQFTNKHQKDPCVLDASNHTVFKFFFSMNPPFFPFKIVPGNGTEVSQCMWHTAAEVSGLHQCMWWRANDSFRHYRPHSTTEELAQTRDVSLIDKNGLPVRAPDVLLGGLNEAWI